MAVAGGDRRSHASRDGLPARHSSRGPFRQSADSSPPQASAPPRGLPRRRAERQTSTLTRTTAVNAWMKAERKAMAMPRRSRSLIADEPRRHHRLAMARPAGMEHAIAEAQADQGEGCKPRRRALDVTDGQRHGPVILLLLGDDPAGGIRVRATALVAHCAARPGVCSDRSWAWPASGCVTAGAPIAVSARSGDQGQQQPRQDQPGSPSST